MNNLIIQFDDVKLEIPLQKLVEMSRKTATKEAVLKAPTPPVAVARPKVRRQHKGSFEYMARQEILKLKAGTSVFIPAADSRKASKKFSNATISLRSMGMPCQIFTRQVVENGVTGVRVWREA